MLTELQLGRFADVLLWGLRVARKGRFNKRDLILLQYDPAAVKLAEVLYERILAAGMHPVQRMGATVPMERSFYGKADSRQLTFIAPGERELLDSINGRIFLRAPDSLTHLREVEPARIAKAIVARKPLREIMDGREDKGFYGWTLTTLPTEELARQANISPAEYTEQVVKACYLDDDNPAGRWQAIHREARAIMAWLNRLPVKYYHIEGEHLDLRITPGDERQWCGVSGHNIPSFELFTSPDWRGTEGTFFANLPSFRSGNYVEGVRLTFTKGAAITVDADTGADFAAKQIAMDRGACRLGEFSLTDRRFSRIDRFMADTLFDENFGGPFGNCHIAVGASYSATYAGDPSTLTKERKRALGFNDSALHWDLINTENKTVTAHLRTGGTRVVYDGGVFKH